MSGNRRLVIDLNGTWDFVADLDPKYHARYGGFENPDADRRHWRKVPVPGVWQAYGARYEIFEGVGWFAREFEVPAFAADAVGARFRFGAVNYLATVYLNGERIGGHEGGYSGFTIDATGKLKPGRNHIAVRVDNRATTIQWPPCLGYFNYGGIHRDVRLEILNGPVLEEVAVRAEPTDEGRGVLEVSGRIFPAPEKKPDALRVRAAVAGTTAGSETVVAENGAFRLVLEAPGVAPWSPESPNLYRVTLSLGGPGNRAEGVLDQREFTCGFRRIAVRDGRVWLNGAPLFLRGICYLADTPGHGVAMTPKEIETDLGLIKRLGCNAVRCHYPMAERFYAACDRIGLLVWIEPTVYCYSPENDESDTMFARPESRAAAETMIEEMIESARNHPSVAIYGLGNECNTTHPEAAPFFEGLAARARGADPTRPLGYAALYGDIGPLADIVDVVGVNSYWGWYDRIQGGKGLEPAADAEDGAGPIDLTPMRRMLDEIFANRKNATLVLTEFGADSIPGLHSGKRVLWSEEYHAELLRKIFSLAAEYPRLAGTFPFCFADYRDPSKVPNGCWNEYNLKGLVSYERRKKKAFTTVEKIYRNFTG